MTVTQIAPLDNKKRKVYIDCEYAFPLYVSDIRKYRLSEGCSIEEDLYDQLCTLVIGRISRRIAYLITDYDKSERDIRNKLLMASYPEILVDASINKLKDYGYIDDRRYARTYADSLIARNKSIIYIRMKLNEKGISRDITDMIIDELSYDENEQIRQLISKKGYDINGLNNIDYDSRRKLYSYLMRQGFSSSAIKHFFSDDNY